MSNERIICCPNCGGDGGWEHIHTDEYPSSYNGDPRRSWVPCIECDGQGEIIIVTSLIDFYDLSSPNLCGGAPWPRS